MTAQTLHQTVALLSRFIDLAGWRSSPRVLSESVPHFRQNLGPDDLLETLQNLELPLHKVAVRLRDLTDADLPCLFIDADGRAHLCEQKLGNSCRAYDPDSARLRELHCDRRIGLAIRLASPDAHDAAEDRKAIAGILTLLRPVLTALFAVSLFTNLAALSVPLMIMVLYDRAIPTGSTDLIMAMTLGLGLVVTFDLALRAIRARALAYVGSQAETRLSLELFRKLCRLPLAELEKNSVDQQITRLKQFESLRDAFSGPVFSAVLDLPFLLLFIGVIFFISPPIGWLILASAAAFLVLAALQTPFLTRLNALSTAARNDHQHLIYETIQHHQGLVRLGLEQIWEDRQAVLCARAARHAAQLRRFQLASQAFGQSVMTLSGVGAVILGTHLAMQGALSLGGLIAIMALVWKALAPLQALYGCIPQIRGFVRSSRQIGRVMALGEISLRGASESAFRQHSGVISPDGVSHRFPGSTTLALSQISFRAGPTECLTISGVNGSSKSALLDILGGLYQPLAGLMRFDGVNYQQISMDDLRAVISYARQEAQFFHGTIAQNLRFGTPLATDAEIWHWLERLGLAEDVRALPEGLETRLTEAFRHAMPKAFFQKLNLARSLIKPAAAYLFDNPGGDLEDADHARLVGILAELKTRRTVILATNHDRFLHLADRSLFLVEGRMIVSDSGAAGQKKVRALLEHAKGGGHAKG